MKEFITKNKSYIKSISLVLIIQAIVYFLVTLILKDYNYISTRFNIPLVKCFIYIYHSWYPFIIYLAYKLYKNDIDNYKKLIFTLIFGFIISNLTFIIYPTIINRPNIEVKNFTDWVINLTYLIDKPTRCLPSEHALVCFIYIYYLIKSKLSNKLKYISIIYLILIIISTLLTHQHLPIDLITAFIYSIIIVFLVKKFYYKLKETLAFLF